VFLAGFVAYTAAQYYGIDRILSADVLSPATAGISTKGR
jgi:hypothetical protein